MGFKKGFRRGQGATEYLLILGVLGLIAVVASSLLGYLPGVTGDAKKETYMAQLRSGEPFSIEDHKSVGGKLTISFANKKGNELNLTHVLLGSNDIDLTQSTGGLSEFSGGMRRVLTFDVPCVDGSREFDVTLVYMEDGVQKEEKLDGKIVVEDCIEGSEKAPGSGCSADSDCAEGTCVGGTCKVDVGECSTNAQCESGNCNQFTHFCDQNPTGICSPLCSIDDPSVVCSETIAGSECSGWQAENPQCSVSANCNGRYSDCSLVCGGVCAGSSEACGGGMPCCSGFACTNGVCAVEEAGTTPACNGIYASCNATTCCDGIYCSQAVGGTCQRCLTSAGGSCNATANCCTGYTCGVGYVSVDVPRGQAACSLPDGSTCSTHSECFNGTCYNGLCKNCNTNNVCNPSNGNADCCFGNLCLQNQSGSYVCQKSINVSGSYEYLYDTSWSMGGSNAVIYKEYSNGTTVEARVFGQRVGKPCTRNEECLSNVCTGGMCAAQTAGSWCSCTGSGYSTCDTSSACPPGLICDPYNYTCVSVPMAPVPSYHYLCRNNTVCYQQCYNNYTNFFTYCNQIFNVCKKGAQPCSLDAQCCSNRCAGGACIAQAVGNWCQVSIYTPTDWPFGIPSTVSNMCDSPMLNCVWNNSYTPLCQ
ncbi:Uncharacterised protein [Candidatus Anstonella stagnisolia]|nr:Uncharacterised protein [Candidatus Anstonella stagnisolia]